MRIPAELPAPVAQFLGEFVGRSRRLRLIYGIGAGLCVFFCWATACCAVDWFARLAPTLRAVLLAFGAVASLVVIVRAVMLARVRTDWVAVAIAAERVNPRFDQKLVTVTSQSLAPPDQRGSDQIIAQLVTDVTSGIRSKESARAPGVVRAIIPWLAILALSLLLGTACKVPTVHASQLAARFLRPFADVPPVTITQLRVSPGAADVVQSQPLTVRVDATNLGTFPPNLLVQSGTQPWMTLPMTSSGDGSYALTIASVDRDQRYAVAGGDARSPDFDVRVLRRPTVTRFDLLYQYPAYTRLKAGTFRNEDGRIEAPAGSRITMTITATEPLAQAALVTGAERIPMTITNPPTSAQVQLVAQANEEYTLELTSDRGVQGGTVTPGVIRVLPDLPPQARVLRGGDSLRLDPRAIIPVAYDALDDYGLVSLSLQTVINGVTSSATPLRLAADSRRQQDTYPFDLARQKLAYGDVLTLTLVATDTGGHETRSTPLQALITPRAVDMDSYQRVVELQHAIQLQNDLVAQLESASALMSAAATQASRQPGGGRLDRELTGAIQSAAMVKQALLRAITHSQEPAFNVALANWIDLNESVANSSQNLFHSRSEITSKSADARALHDPIESARSVIMQAQIVVHRELASALRSDLENLAALRSRPAEKAESARQRAEMTLERMKQEIADEARHLTLAPDAGDLATQVQGIIDLGDRTLRASSPVSFGLLTLKWAQVARGDKVRRTGLEARLEAAAQAEAVRPDADLLRARDLELAGRAVAILRTNTTVEGVQLDSVAAAIRTLVDRPERTSGLHPATLPAADLVALAAARTVLRRAANEIDERLPNVDGPVDGQRDLESLAIAANAASASRQYGQAADIEAQMYRRLRTRFRRDRSSVARSQPAEDAQGVLPDRIERRREAARRETDAAKKLDELDQRQQSLVHADGVDPLELSQRQRRVADELATIAQGDGQGQELTPDGRDQATSEVMAAVEQLAAMPQALANAQNAAASRRDASRRAKAAKAAATHAAAGSREVLERVSHGADRTEKDALERFRRAAAPLAPAKAELLAQRLGAYAPETDAARDLLLVRLSPILKDLQESLAGDDANDTNRAGSDARDAIFAAQRELAASRDLLVRRDPLAAARSFARLAADSLAASPPNLNGAKLHQAEVFESLSHAWDQSIHRAAQQRLASIPSMAAVLGSPMARDSDTTSRPSDRFSNARQWDRMRADDDVSLDTTLHDSEPAGYEQSLKLYFEALGRGPSGQEH